jgi:hypothetical protein
MASQTNEFFGRLVTIPPVLTGARVRLQSKANSWSKVAVGCAIFCITAGLLCGLGLSGGLAFLLTVFLFFTYFLFQALIRKQNVTSAIVACALAVCCIFLGINQGLIPDARYAWMNAERKGLGLPPLSSEGFMPKSPDIVQPQNANFGK